MPRIRTALFALLLLPSLAGAQDLQARLRADLEATRSRWEPIAQTMSQSRSGHAGIKLTPPEAEAAFLAIGARAQEMGEKNLATMRVSDAVSGNGGASATGTEASDGTVVDTQGGVVVNGGGAFGMDGIAVAGEENGGASILAPGQITTTGDGQGVGPGTAAANGNAQGGELQLGELTDNEKILLRQTPSALLARIRAFVKTKAMEASQEYGGVQPLQGLHPYQIYVLGDRVPKMDPFHINEVLTRIGDLYLVNPLRFPSRALGHCFVQSSSEEIVKGWMTYRYYRGREGVDQNSVTAALQGMAGVVREAQNMGASVGPTQLFYASLHDMFTKVQRSGQANKTLDVLFAVYVDHQMATFALADRIRGSGADPDRGKRILGSISLGGGLGGASLVLDTQRGAQTSPFGNISDSEFVSRMQKFRTDRVTPARSKVDQALALVEQAQTQGRDPQALDRTHQQLMALAFGTDPHRPTPDSIMGIMTSPEFEAERRYLLGQGLPEGGAAQQLYRALFGNQSNGTWEPGEVDKIQADMRNKIGPFLRRRLVAQGEIAPQTASEIAAAQQNLTRLRNEIARIDQALAALKRQQEANPTPERARAIAELERQRADLVRQYQEQAQNLQSGNGDPAASMDRLREVDQWLQSGQVPDGQGGTRPLRPEERAALEAERDRLVRELFPTPQEAAQRAQQIEQALANGTDLRGNPLDSSTEQTMREELDRMNRVARGENVPPPGATAQDAERYSPANRPATNPANNPVIPVQPPQVIPTSGQPQAIDPNTGNPIDPTTGNQVDPVTGRQTPPTGQPISPVTRQPVDPRTGLPLPTDPSGNPVTPGTNGTPQAIDPVTGRAIDPATGRLIDPATGQVTNQTPQGIPTDPATGLPVDPRTMQPLPTDPTTGNPVDPTTGQQLDPRTGQPIGPATGTPVPNAGRQAVDPTTGNPIDPRTGQQVDPNTGQVIGPATGIPVDPITGRPVDPTTGQELPRDPTTGNPVDPRTGQQLDPQTGQPIGPATGDPIPPGGQLPGQGDTPTVNPGAVDPNTGNPIDPETGNQVDPITGEDLGPATGQPVNPITGDAVDPETGETLPVDPTTGNPVDPETGRQIDPETGELGADATGTPLDPTSGRPVDEVGLPGTRPGTPGSAQNNGDGTTTRVDGDNPSAPDGTEGRGLTPQDLINDNTVVDANGNPIVAPNEDLGPRPMSDSEVAAEVDRRLRAWQEQFGGNPWSLPRAANEGEIRSMLQAAANTGRTSPGSVDAYGRIVGGNSAGTSVTFRGSPSPALWNSHTGAMETVRGQLEERIAAQRAEFEAEVRGSGAQDLNGSGSVLDDGPASTSQGRR